MVLFDRDVVQPDLLFLANLRVSIIQERTIDGPPDVIIEIFPPTTEQRDRRTKQKLQAWAGVREYWLWTLPPRPWKDEGLPNPVLSGSDSTTSTIPFIAPAFSGFSMPLSDMFRSDTWPS